MSRSFSCQTELVGEKETTDEQNPDQCGLRLASIGSMGKALPHIEYWIKFERNSCLWINKLGLSLWGNIFFFENKIYRKCWNKIIGLRVDFHLAKSLSSHERGSDFQHCQSQCSFACKLGWRGLPRFDVNFITEQSLRSNSFNLAGFKNISKSVKAEVFQMAPRKCGKFDFMLG